MEITYGLPAAVAGRIIATAIGLVTPGNGEVPSREVGCTVTSSPSPHSDDPVVDVRLRSFDPGPDAQRLEEWLRQPHVAPWWGDPRLALEDALRRSSDTCAIILADGVPVGYLCWQMPSREELAAAGLADLPDGLVDIDLVVGEPTAVGRGIGPRSLGLLLGRLRADPSVIVAGVGTSTANRRAIRAFTKAGFGLFREFQDPAFGPCWYMTVDVGRSA